jgi:hypothetical protein
MILRLGGTPVAAIDTPKDAERLARAITADVLLYNEDALFQGFEQGRPLRNMAQELREAKALYDSRVSAAVREQGPLFACVFEQLVERWAIGHRLPVAGLDAAVAAVFGEQPQAVAAFRQGGAAPPTQPSGGQTPSSPPAPRSAAAAAQSSGARPLSSPPKPRSAAPTATPVAPPSAARLPARTALYEGHLVLESRALSFEHADLGGRPVREELPLYELQELRLRRQIDGSWELGLTAGPRSESWLLARTDDAVAAARHVLGRLARPAG